MTTYSRWTTKFEIKPGSWVFVPSEKSIEVGKEIKSIIENRWNNPPFYYHLRKGGHINAIKIHLQSTSFFHLDIRDFYGSINKSRVTRCVKKILGYDRAREIARESTVRHPTDKEKKIILPFGFVQSPILASLCLAESSLGVNLNKLHKQKDIHISVYVDDIIVSTREKIDLTHIFNSIKESAKKSKFEFNSEKEEGPCGGITVFNINIKHKYLEIEDKRFEKFLSAYSNSSNDHQKKGIRRYINAINFGQAKALEK